MNLARTRPVAAAALASVAALCATALIPSASPASAGKRQTLHFFSKDTSFTYKRANGTVVDPPPKDVQAGDSFDATSVAFVGNHRHHARQWTASSHLHCLVQADHTPTCDSQAALGGSLILFHGDTIVGGAGRYAGATGNVRNTDVPGGTDSVVRIRRR